MQPYRVTHNESGDRFYVLADSEDHAIERVALHIGDASGREAWSASLDTPGYGLSESTVLDGSGKPVTSVET